VHPKIVQERLGHASITTTLDIYSHVTPGMQEAAARASWKRMPLKPVRLPNFRQAWVIVSGCNR